jgi:hypothetical protein
LVPGKGSGSKNAVRNFSLFFSLFLDLDKRSDLS